MLTNRTRLMISAVGLVCLLAALSTSIRAVQKSETPELDQTKLNRLLKNKLDILQEDVDHLENLHKLGQAGFEELYAAHLAKNLARLDLCETDQQKLAVFDELLTEAKRREDAVCAIHGTAPSLGVHKAQIDRLDIEIHIERIKGQGNGEHR